MRKAAILVICGDEATLQTVLRVINNNPSWHAAGTGDEETAIELFHQYSYGLVILCADLLKESELKLRTLFRIQNPNIKIIQYWDGGSGLLINEINAALDDKKAGNLNVIDDAFKTGPFQ